MIDLKLNRAQRRAYNALFDEHGKPYRGRTIFIGFGRGVGKSWFLRQMWWLLVALYDYTLRTDALDPFHGVRITVVCPTLKQFKQIHLAGIEEELGGKWSFLGGKIDRQSGAVKFPGGSLIRPFPATAHNARTARGMRTDVLCADEIDDIDAEVYDGTAIPWLSEPWSLGLELLAGTPTRGRHGLWWNKMSAGRLGERLRNGEPPPPDLTDEDAEAYKTVHSFHATYEDVPEIVSAAAVAKAKATTFPATFEREWRANPDAGEGLVYPFDETFHVRHDVPPLSSFREFHIGMDHGWVDPGVLILFGVLGHGEDAEVWAIDESYESMVPPHEWDQRMLNWRGATVWGDPSRPDRIDAARKNGFPIGNVDNEILPGIARLADMIFKRSIENSDDKWCRFYVSPKCANLIREFGLYRRKKQTDGTFSEKPADKDNHTLDATRYFILGRFGRAPNYRTELRG